MVVTAFCFYLFLIGRLWAEILTAKVWWKSVKSWQAPIFCRRQYLWCFCMASQYKWAGRESTHKSRVASGNTTFGGCMRRGHHLQEGKHQGGLGEASYCGLCQAKTLRRCFWACANILFDAYIFCQRIYILSTPMFVTAPNFWRRLTFVGAYISLRIYILSTPMFWRRLIFVGT